MKKVCVVTATRAEYGILTPLIKRIDSDDELDLQLLITGTHLSPKHGMTVDRIDEDGFDTQCRIPILEEGNDALAVSKTVANAIVGFAMEFRNARPDLVVILGDRTEMLGVAIAALNENIPIAHISGGEVTMGAVDDSIRHSLSKMSYIHFASTEIYRKRIIRMGESPDRVFNVGALSTENILNEALMSERQTREDLGLPDHMEYALLTLHPETVNGISVKLATEVMCQIMDNVKDVFFVITASNSDVGGDEINARFIEYAGGASNACYITSLGMKRYLSAVKYSAFVLGNSSSGVIEAPVLGVPAINIGNRQKGRIMAKSVLSVSYDAKEIMYAIDRARNMSRVPDYIYGDGTTSEQIVKIIKSLLLDKGIALQKEFYDGVVE